MKLSKFSVFIDTPESSQYILYNTLTGVAILVDEPARHRIESARFTELAPQLRTALMDSDILVKRDIDENLVFSIRRDRAKYSSTALRFVVLPTFDCNLSCRYCYVAPLWHGRQTPGSMSHAALGRVIHFAVNTLHTTSPEEVDIDFTGGGEPLLALGVVVDIMRALRVEATRRGIPVRANLITNGTLISDELLRPLCGFDVTFQVTLDGPRHIHDVERSRRDGTGTYDRVIEGLKTVARHGFRRVVRVNVSRRNIAGIPEFFGQLRSEFEGNLPIKLVPVLASSDRHSSWASDCLCGDQLDGLPELWQLATDMGFFPILAPPLSLLPCPAAVDACYVIDPRAEVYKCEALAGQQEFRVGTIGEDGSLSRPSYAYYQWMAINGLDNPECRECALLPACGGECPASVQLRMGSYTGSTCTKSKKAITESIRIQLVRFGTILSLRCYGSG